jgi:hypothetical protein
MPVFDERFKNVLSEEILLEQLKFGVQRRIGYGAAQSLNLEMIKEVITDQMIFSLTAEMLAERIGGEQIRKHERVQHVFTPIDGPFQRWKDRHKTSWWLRWFVRWRPVCRLYEELITNVTLQVDVKDYATFPEHTVAYPPQLGPVKFRRIANSQIWKE